MISGRWGALMLMAAIVSKVNPIGSPTGTDFTESDG
jgi:hypothetical protein